MKHKSLAASMITFLLSSLWNVQVLRPHEIESIITVMISLMIMLLGAMMLIIKLFLVLKDTNRDHIHWRLDRGN